MEQLTLPRPDDWHLHLREGATLRAVAQHSAEVFARAIIMPNLNPPVTSREDATAYRQRILAALPEGSSFEPLMTLYLSEQTSAAQIEAAATSGIVAGAKLYPAGATTNSTAGVNDLRNCHATLARMAELGMPLLVHGEHTRVDIDIFEREQAFIDQVLLPLRDRHPELKIVFEHVTSAAGARLVTGNDPNLAGTFTPQHLLYNRNHLLVGGLKPHFYCMPILKREDDRAALVEAATSGHPRVFLGTDSAPHRRAAKESACGCAGCFSAPIALGLYAEVFAAAGKLDQLEAFASRNGPAFYGLPVNSDSITLQRRAVEVPLVYSAGGEEEIVPLRAGERVEWSIAPGEP